MSDVDPAIPAITLTDPARLSFVCLPVIGGPPVVLSDFSSLPPGGLEVEDRHLNLYELWDNLDRRAPLACRD